MATQLFLRDTNHVLCGRNGGPNLRGTTGAWQTLTVATTRGGGVVASQATATVAGATAGVEVNHRTAPNARLDWLSDPLSADFTISGTVTLNIWSSESSMNANVAINVQIDRINGNDGVVTSVLTTARVTEVAITTRAANNFTATPTSTNFLRGDRIRIRVFGDDAGTMGSGFTFDMSYNGTTAAADGDSYVTFTENLTFESTEPAGTTLYLTDNATGLGPGDGFNNREMWTSRDVAAQTKATDTVSGWVFQGVEMTNGVAGAQMEWFSRMLTAFTLGGTVRVNARGFESAAGANAAIGVEIFITASDGTSPVEWGVACPQAELGTAEAAISFLVSGDDTSVSEGQRLMVRPVMNAAGINGPLVLGNTVSFVYGGPTGGATGDFFLTFSQTLTESSGPPPADPYPYAGGGYYGG